MSKILENIPTVSDKATAGSTTVRMTPAQATLLAIVLGRCEGADFSFWSQLVGVLVNHGFHEELVREVREEIAKALSSSPGREEGPQTIKIPRLEEKLKNNFLKEKEEIRRTSFKPLDISILPRAQSSK